MKILVIDEDECIARTLAQGLTYHDHLVNTTNNGQTGLDLARAHDYDAIVLDVILPELDGLNVCRQLRAGGKKMPILFLSTRNTPQQRQQGLAAGANDYMSKTGSCEALVTDVLQRLHGMSAQAS